MQGEFLAFDRSLGCQIGHDFKSRNIFRAAIGIARKIHRIDPDKNIPTLQHFRPGQRQRQHDGVAGGHIGDWDATRNPVDRYGKPGIGQGGTAELGEIKSQNPMLDGVEGLRNPSRCVQFGSVALSVGKGEAIGRKTLMARLCQTGCGIQSAGEEHNRFCGHGALSGYSL